MHVGMQCYSPCVHWSNETHYTTHYILQVLDVEVRVTPIVLQQPLYIHEADARPSVVARVLEIGMLVSFRLTFVAL